jgi:hypothetical protein
VLQPTGAPYYFVATLSLSQLMAAEGDALRREDGGGGGKTYGLSLSASPLEQGDALALTPDGALHLSLTRDTFVRLGVAGQAATPPRGACARRRAEARYCCRLPPAPRTTLCLCTDFQIRLSHFQSRCARLPSVASRAGRSHCPATTSSVCHRTTTIQFPPWPRT